MKGKVDKLDVDKLASVPVALSKLSDIIKNHVFKNTKYNLLVKRVIDTDVSIDTSGFVKKKQKTNDDSKINEIKRKMSSITGLATTAALNDFKNNIPNFSDLVKKWIMIQY